MAYTTRKSLLLKVRDGDDISWEEFFHTYRPLIIVRGRDYQLRGHELDELVELVMLTFFEKKIFECKFDIENPPPDLVIRQGGPPKRFRNYLRAVVTRQALSLLRKRGGNHIPLDDFEYERLPGADFLEQSWQREWEKHLQSEALKELRNCVQTVTYQAFEMVAIQERSVQETAEFLDISPASVYTHKSRCLKKMREILTHFREEYS